MKPEEGIVVCPFFEEWKAEGVLFICRGPGIICPNGCKAFNCVAAKEIIEGVE